MVVVPMAQHVFFLALMQTVVYVVMYTSILFTRYRMGRVTNAMLNVARKCRSLFVSIGAAEAVAAVLLLVATKHLPGAILPLLQQSAVIWNFIFSALILGREFDKTELIGALLVMSGVVVASQSPSGAALKAGAIASVDPRYVTLFVCSCALPATAAILKDKIFSTAKADLGVPLDIFVVNSAGSTAQMLGTLLLLPILAAQQNVALASLPAYVSEGARCVAREPLMPVLYTCCNLAFNICVLTVLRTLGSTSLIIGASLIIPMTIWVFTFDLPFIGAGSALGMTFLAGTALILTGLLVYNYRKLRTSPVYQTTDSPESSDYTSMPMAEGGAADLGG